MDIPIWIIKLILNKINILLDFLINLVIKFQLNFNIIKVKIIKVIDIVRNIKIPKLEDVLLMRSNVFNILISTKKIKINNDDII